MRFDKIRQSGCAAAVGPHFRLGRGIRQLRRGSAVFLKHPRRALRSRRDDAAGGGLCL